MAGDTRTRELLALKRVGIDLPASGHRGTCTTRLALPRCNGAGQPLTHVTLFLLSDSYLGLDQQLDVRLVDSSKGAQVSEGAGKGAQQGLTDSAQGEAKAAEAPADWAPASGAPATGAASARARRGGDRKALTMSEAITADGGDPVATYEDEPGCG